MILNSFGKLSNYFAISDIVFLGGSLVHAGGHNPIEPAQHKCAIITGPHLFNWQNIFDEMIQNESCIMISSIENFKFELQELFKNKNKIEKLKKNSYIFSKKEFIDTNLLNKTINNHMKNI